MKRITVDLILPASWRASQFFWLWRGRAAGFVVAFEPLSWAVGFEIIAGDDRAAKGLAVVVGPLWLGFATIEKDRP